MCKSYQQAVKQARTSVEEHRKKQWDEIKVALLCVHNLTVV